METNFFGTLASLGIKGQIQMVISLEHPDMVSVAILLRDPNNVGNVLTGIPPLSLTDSVAGLDATFFTRIKAPLVATVAVKDNLAEYEAALALSRKKLADKKATTSNTTATAKPDPKMAKYNEQIKKVDALACEKKYGQAIGALPNAADFPSMKETIEARRAELTKLMDASRGVDLFSSAPSAQENLPVATGESQEGHQSLGNESAAAEGEETEEGLGEEEPDEEDEPFDPEALEEEE